MKADATKKERVILCGFIGYRERIAASMRIKHACRRITTDTTYHATHRERRESRTIVEKILLIDSWFRINVVSVFSLNNEKCISILPCFLIALICKPLVTNTCHALDHEVGLENRVTHFLIGVLWGLKTDLHKVFVWLKKFTAKF